MQLRVSHTIGHLADDLTDIAKRADRDQTEIVKDGARAGNMLAKESARRTAGKHGKHYHRAFTAEYTGRGLFGNTFSAEYGPLRGRKQGEMSFERGSRNQPPHWDLARSADVIGPAFAQEVRQLLDRLFWGAGRGR